MVLNPLPLIKRTPTWLLIVTAAASGLGFDYLPRLWPTRTVDATTALAAPVGTDATIEFVPRSGTVQGETIILNDRKNYREPGTVTVVFDKAKFPQLLPPKNTFGKTLTVTGKTSRYGDSPQLVAEKVSVK